MWSHNVTSHPTQVNAPRLTRTQTGRYSIYWIDLLDLSKNWRLSWFRRGWFRYSIPMWFTCSQPVTHSKSISYLIAIRPWVKPITTYTSNGQTVAPPSLQVFQFFGLRFLCNFWYKQGPIFYSCCILIVISEFWRYAMQSRKTMQPRENVV